jgi:hypothetical protein
LTATFNYVFDDRDYPGIKLTIEAEIIPGVRATSSHPSVESDVVIGSIEGDFRVYYEEDYFTKEEWQRILDAAETKLIGG